MRVCHSATRPGDRCRLARGGRPPTGRRLHRYHLSEGSSRAGGPRTTRLSWRGGVIVSVWSRFERRLEGLVEGAFARAFKSELQPVEVARALAREVDDRAAIIGKGRVLVPNDFVVEIGETDHSRLSVYSDSLGSELATVVSEHAKEEGYHLVGRVQVRFRHADDLRTGVFRVRSGVQPTGRTPHSVPAFEQHPQQQGYQPPPEPPQQGYQDPQYAPQGYQDPPYAQQGYPDQPYPDPNYPDPNYPPHGYQDQHYDPHQGQQGYADPQYYQHADPNYPGQGYPDPGYGHQGYPPVPVPHELPEPYSQPPPEPYPHAGYTEDERTRVTPLRPRQQAHLETPDGTVVGWLTGPVNVVGRGSESDVKITDPGISRRHAEIRLEGNEYIVTDLGSTNGTIVDGRPVRRASLYDGSSIQFGRTTVTFRVDG
ncbi:MAG: DUF2662 domain-containing protein [Streptosporangiales bacterium]|nr:DUF2662 domain-containing protein [Streptosporangiales bacterium]